jgi:hypothetical protein
LDSTSIAGRGGSSRFKSVTIVAGKVRLEIGPGLVIIRFEAPFTATIREKARFEDQALSNAHKLGIGNWFVGQGRHPFAVLQLFE